MKLSSLSDEQRETVLSKDVQHYLPWRVVYKESISTPCRTVMDASSKTPFVKGGGGRCLNDLTMKGKVDSLNLMNMLLRFVAGKVGFTGDLRQFYTSMALDENQWHLQRAVEGRIGPRC